MSLARRREAVEHAVTVLPVSERRACRAIGQIRSSTRYVPWPDPFRERLCRGSSHWPSSTDGMTTERSRISCGARAGTWETIAYARLDDTKACAHTRSSRSGFACGPPIAIMCVADDFVVNQTQDGRPFLILNIVDEYTRECLASVIACRIDSHDMIVVLEGLFLKNGGLFYTLKEP